MIELADALPRSVTASNTSDFGFKTAEDSSLARKSQDRRACSVGKHRRLRLSGQAPSLRRATRAPSAPIGLSGHGHLLHRTSLAAWDTLTNSTANCLSAYLNGEPNWNPGRDPSVASPECWLRPVVAMKSPTTRQLVLQVDLIPTSVQDTNDPLSWEQSCDAGHFNSYATKLGRHLVAAGLGHSVIRLGAEANTDTETDFIGNTVREEKAWAKCLRQRGRRSSSGEGQSLDRLEPERLCREHSLQRLVSR